MNLDKWIVFFKFYFVVFWRNIPIPCQKLMAAMGIKRFITITNDILKIHAAYL